MKLFINTLFSALFLMSIAFSAQSPAQEAKRDTWHNHRETLPPFCAIDARKRAPFNGPNYGGSMVWGNHLCKELWKLPGCRTLFGEERLKCLNRRTRGYTYWISHASPNFALLPYLHTGLGDLYFEIGNKTEAIKEFQLALKKNPKYLKAYKSLIDAFIDLHQYDNAQHDLDKAIAIKPHKAFKRRQEKLNKLKKSQ